jgi:cytochrome b pre-mRNA-processing protein 3
MFKAFLRKWFAMFSADKSGPLSESVEAIYRILRERARQPVHFLRDGAPDEVEGRFSVLVMHAYPLLERLAGHEGVDPRAGLLSKALVDRLFHDVDDSMRALGVGDASIARKVRALGEAYAGQVRAYRAAKHDVGELGDALHRNVCRLASRDAAEQVAKRMLDQISVYGESGVEALIRGDLPANRLGDDCARSGQQNE